MISPIPSTNSSGGQSYTDSPFTSTGSPALGLAIIGTLAYSAIFLTKGTNSLGPLEQLRPTASAPILCRTITAISGVVPYRVVPSSLYVRDTRTGRSQVSFTARRAALHSCRLIIVSMIKRSTPASYRILACSLYTFTSSSKVISPTGDRLLPVIEISPATNALSATASLDISTSLVLISTILSASSYSSSLILLPVNVGARTILDPAST